MDRDKGGIRELIILCEFVGVQNGVQQLLQHILNLHYVWDELKKHHLPYGSSEL